MELGQIPSQDEAQGLIGDIQVFVGATQGLVGKFQACDGDTQGLVNGVSGFGDQGGGVIKQNGGPDCRIAEMGRNTGLWIDTVRITRLRIGTSLCESVVVWGRRRGGRSPLLISRKPSKE